MDEHRAPICHCDAEVACDVAKLWSSGWRTWLTRCATYAGHGALDVMRVRHSSYDCKYCTMSTNHRPLCPKDRVGRAPEEGRRRLMQHAYRYRSGEGRSCWHILAARSWRMPCVPPETPGSSVARTHTQLALHRGWRCPHNLKLSEQLLCGNTTPDDLTCANRILDVFVDGPALLTDVLAMSSIVEQTLKEVLHATLSCCRVCG